MRIDELSFTDISSFHKAFKTALPKQNDNYKLSMKLMYYNSTETNSKQQPHKEVNKMYKKISRAAFNTGARIWIDKNLQNTLRTSVLRL